jgi:hypothetical protein
MEGSVISLVRLAWISVSMVALVACRGAEPVAPRATVYFVLDAPLCSSIIPVQFSVDSLLVGSDTFRVDVSQEHTTSRGFMTSVGQHTLGARVVNGYVWPDKIVTLAAGEVYAYPLPFYCS